jgi:hypothetical protein
MSQEIAQRAFEVFGTDLAAVPGISLRSANAIDSYETPLPFDPVLDEPTDAYLERYTFWGQAYLDPASWRHYLARWIDYSMRHPGVPTTMVIEGLLASLRPPDREPPRLASLTPEQEEVVVAFLEHAAGGFDRGYDGALAQQALDEWWGPDPHYRRAPGAGA